MIHSQPSVFFNPREFAVEATLAGQPVVGILDRGYALGDVGMVGMAGTQPVFTCPTPAGDPAGQVLIVGADSFVVVAHEPDGTGVSRLLLEVST
ncbi:MAG: hypothetical protein N2690_07280 [Rhodocyclaceae bacterium]|nr:hypothetical protein [Rhodocyclaceae bacterium]